MGWIGVEEVTPTGETVMRVLAGDYLAELENPDVLAYYGPLPSPTVIPEPEGQLALEVA